MTVTAAEMASIKLYAAIQEAGAERMTREDRAGLDVLLGIAPKNVAA
jgi:hypothetical protein